MERPQANYSLSMPKNVFTMTTSRSGSGFDRQAYTPFQAIIAKGRQAKAQDEHEQYEAKKLKRETEIKNAARIRHAEAEANRRRAEESKLSIDDHKGKLLDEMTKNIKATLEDQYREEIREKVYEDEDKIVSSYEHDIKDQTKARLVNELESVVKAKLEAEFEPIVKQQLAAEFESVVKEELRANYTTQVKQQLVEELGPEIEAELRKKYETEIKQQLAEELRPVVEAQIRAHYEKEHKNQLMIGPTITRNLNGIHTNGVDNDSQGQRDSEAESFTAIPHPDEIDNEGGEYPDLSHHQHLINKNVIQNSQQDARSVYDSVFSDTNGGIVEMSHTTKRSRSGADDDEEDPYANRSKRSRSASFHRDEQGSPIHHKEGVSNLHSCLSTTIHQSYQGVNYNNGGHQGFLQHQGDAGYNDVQSNSRYEMDRRHMGYDSSDGAQGRHGNIVSRVGAAAKATKDVQGTNENFLDLEEEKEEEAYSNAEDVQGVNGNISHGEAADYDSTEDFQGMNGNLVHDEESDDDSTEDFRGINGHLEVADHDGAEDLQGNIWYKAEGETIESYGDEEEVEEEDEDEEEGEEEEDEDGEDYASDEEEQYSTDPQAAPHSNAANGVITFTNTQDTALVLSDSEDDEDKADNEDKTLVEYDDPMTLNDSKYYNVHVEESLFLDA